MDHLPHFFEPLLGFLPGPFQAALTRVDDIGQESAHSLDAIRVAARLQFDALRLEEAVQISVELVFLDSFHGLCRLRDDYLATASAPQLQIQGEIVERRHDESIGGSSLIEPSLGR
ncbi:MAG TPA: hypothetical protein VI136_22840 [Verrucomicrobiae bacterium]